MASVDLAIQYVLSWEDPSLSGVITTDTGGRTRFGIAERYHPELTASLFYTSLGNDAALVIAKSVYDISYCQPLCIVDIGNQDIANKVLSLGVNLGVERAGQMLQDVLMVPCDGRIGPITMMALDRADPNEVLFGLRSEAEKYYLEDVEKHPEKEVDLKGWLRRAEA